MSESVVKTPGDVEGEETEHERCQYDDYHLH